MKEIPRLQLAHLPTALEPLPRLASELGGAMIWVKRDDQTGLALGGNKTRKLEFLLAEAKANGAHTLITTGAVQSNHCRQTAAAAARYGFKCILVLTLLPGEDEKAMTKEQATGNFLLDSLFGAEIVWAKSGARDQVLKETYEDAWSLGMRPYLIPYGGSNPTGATAFAFAIRELLEQDLNPDWIVFPSSSGGTQAGLVLGRRLFGYRGRVLGISVDEPGDRLRQIVAELASETAEFLGEPITISMKDVDVNDEFLGEGYGVVGEGEKEAIHMFAHLEGLLLDPVYTGRAAAGLISLIRSGAFPAGETVLFWHTGGTPALFAEKYQNILEVAGR